MNRYETIVIIDPELQDEERSLFLDKLTDLISQYKGLKIIFDEWGNKRLAYEIKKKTRGFYIRIDYCGTGILVDEMERLLRIDDRVLKYLTVLLNKNVDIESIQEEIVKYEAEVKQPESNKIDKSEPN